MYHFAKLQPALLCLTRWHVCLAIDEILNFPRLEFIYYIAIKNIFKETNFAFLLMLFIMTTSTDK